MQDILFEASIEKRLKAYRVPSAPRSSRKKRSIGDHTTFWGVGSTLRISFAGHPEEDLKQAIVAVARAWLVHANLDFELVDDDDQTADIRIDTAVPPAFNESVLGLGARDMDGPSMSLGARPADEHFRRIVLHEFGHALGMDHEHQHPMANIPWDFDALRALLAERLAPEATSDEELEAMIEETIESNYLPVTSQDVVTLDYDPASIMHYPVKQELTLGDWQMPGNDELSAKDKQFMRMAYPGRENIEV
ncbi:peptidase M12 [Pseudomonas sichuanensis]|uniref:peptidase M12 n=1 Tax=Pseudomonas TaxID=286 RepID=UPI0038287ED7